MLCSPGAERVTKGRLIIVWVSFSCHRRQEKNEKKRRSWGRGASKFGKWDWGLKFCVYAEFFAILSPLRNPLSCAPAERARWGLFWSVYYWNRWCWFRWERTGCGTQGLRVYREIYLSTVRFVRWLELLIARGYLLFWKMGRQSLSFSAWVFGFSAGARQSPTVLPWRTSPVSGYKDTVEWFEFIVILTICLHHRS